MLIVTQVWVAAAAFAALRAIGAVRTNKKRKRASLRRYLKVTTLKLAMTQGPVPRQYGYWNADQRFVLFENKQTKQEKYVQVYHRDTSSCQFFALGKHHILVHTDPNKA